MPVDRGTHSAAISVDVRVCSPDVRAAAGGVCASACRHAEGPAAAALDEGTTDTLTRVIAELRMHLRDDTYRQARPVTSDGRDLFGSIQWKLDRMQLERGSTRRAGRTSIT